MMSGSSEVHLNIYQHVYGILFVQGVRGDAVGRGTAVKAGRSRVRFRMGSLGYSIVLIFRRLTSTIVDVPHR